MTVNGSLPAPMLRWREGDMVTLRVTNTLDEDASIHWHGIVLPANMDGVPGLSFGGIRPGETYIYRFAVRQSGTYWYHSHSGFQEQQGLYGPLVIDPREPEPVRYDREHVVLLTDWTDEDPARSLREAEEADRTTTTTASGRSATSSATRGATGWARRSPSARAWGGMRMSPTDLADVTGATYTYLMNGAPPAGNWTGLFRPGERVRLRFINGSAMTYFDVRIPGLKMTIVAADGLPVQPVTVDEFRIAVAETYDVIVEPSGQDAFTIFAQAMDRTGYGRRHARRARGPARPVPALDPRPMLTMADMGHGGIRGHAAAAARPARRHATPKPADPHAGHTMPQAPPTRMPGTTGARRQRPSSIPRANAAIRSSTCRRRARRRAWTTRASACATTAGGC